MTARFNYAQWAKDHPLSLKQLQKLYDAEARRSFVELAYDALTDDGGFWRDAGHGVEQWVTPR